MLAAMSRSGCRGSSYKDSAKNGGRHAPDPSSDHSFLLVLHFYTCSDHSSFWLFMYTPQLLGMIRKSTCEATATQWESEPEAPCALVGSLVWPGMFGRIPMWLVPHMGGPFPVLGPYQGP